ncbi:hypothetical protein NC996_17960 [Trichocoleus sp. ST-U2]|uniref:hypothetical protein n=1 Tax=Coleofasciculus sp. FACHB-SPT9 TaxID=2692791 RepID=UPI0030D8A5C0
MERINELLEGDRASDVELQKLSQRLVKPDGEAWEEGELVDIRLAEDLKRRRQQKRCCEAQIEKMTRRPACFQQPIEFAYRL